MDTMFKLLDAIVQGPAPIIKRTKINRYIVSTVETVDQGPETAILDENGAHPVERYESREKAEEGHKAWVKLVKGGLKEIDGLGYDDAVPSRRIVLVPMETAS